MTSLMVNTLRIIDSTHGQSVSLKSGCTCLQKEWDLGGDGRGEGVLFVFFSQNKRETKMSNLRNYSIAFLFLPFLKTTTSSMG